MTDHTWRESIEAEGEQLLKKIEHVIAEGNVRKIEITHEGRTVAEFPLTIGVVGALLAPVLAAIGAIAAVLTDCKIEVERVGEKK
jgi:uncharacterized integral membrane protein